MNSFKIALINELEKLFKKKRALLTVIISLIFIVLGQISIILLRKNFGVVGTSSAEFPILILSILSNTILPLFILLMTIESFSNEFSQNTFKIALTRPITRFKLYSAKIISVLIFIFSNLMLVFIISVISGFIFNERYISSGNIGKIFISYIVTMMPLIVVCLAAVFFSNIIKNGLAVFFLFILVFIGLKVFHP
jgi:ABC-2 type transport system permease protein